jgi:hypothetical protein
MINRILPGMALAVLGLSSTLVHAIPPIPEESGWSGHIGLGIGAGSSESNMLAEIGGIDLGDDRVSGLDQSPDDEDIVLPGLPFEVAYTWADSSTQLFLGSRQARHFTFEVDTTLHIQAGVRQSLSEVGVVSFAIVASTTPTEVWKDPYIEGDTRGNTERTSSGLAMEWGDVFHTPLSFTWTAIEVEVDDEESGRQGALGLTNDQQRALRREGEIYRAELNYDWQINERHSLVPGIGYIDNDLDGAAMAEDGLLLQLQHVYDAGGWSLVSKLYLEDLESDESNPIYGDSNDIETIGGSITALFEEPFGLKDWTTSAGASYYEGDSENDFYDSSLSLFSLGMLYRF